MTLNDEPAALPIAAPAGPVESGPIPGPDMGPGGRTEPDDRFTIFVAVVITVVSILIAVTAWRTTEAANRASDLDSLAIQQLARRQQELEALSGQVDLDLRLYSRFQEHVLGAQQLQTAANAALATNAPAAQRLVLEAQGNRALARVLRQFFRGAIPDVDVAGVAAYDPDFVLRNLMAGSTRMADLRPGVTAHGAEVAHAQTAAFVLLVIILAGCLVLLTVAQVVHGRGRRLFAFAGTVGAVSAVGLIAAVELILFQVAA